MRADRNASTLTESIRPRPRQTLMTTNARSFRSSFVQILRSKSSLPRPAKSHPDAGRRAWSSWAIRDWRCAARFRACLCFQICGDPGRAEGVVADPRLDAGGRGATLNHPVGILLPHGVWGELAGLACR